MTAVLKPSPADTQGQIAEAHKWLYPGATQYLQTRYRAVIEILERVLREDLSDEDIYQLSFEFHRDEQLALGIGDAHGAVAHGAKHEAVEWLRNKADEPVEEF
jgi:hypothetical protein